MSQLISFCDIRWLLLTFCDCFTECVLVPADFYANNVVFMLITCGILLCLGTFGVVDYTNYDDMKYAVSL